MQSHSSTTDTPCLQCFSCYVITGSIQLNKLRPITACLPSADHHNAKCQLFRETHFLTNSSKTDSKSMTFARLYASSSICIVHFKKTRGFSPRLDLSRGLSRCTLSVPFLLPFSVWRSSLCAAYQPAVANLQHVGPLPVSRSHCVGRHLLLLQAEPCPAASHCVQASTDK